MPANYVSNIIINGVSREVRDAAARAAIEALRDRAYIVGVTTTALDDGDTTNPIVVLGEDVTVTAGAIATYDSAEFLFNGTAWQKLGSLGIVVDNSLSTTSENPVQNAVITTALATKATQYTTLPVASENNLDKVVQFIGTTTSELTNGYFYKCVSDGGDPATYSWEQVNVQPAEIYCGYYYNSKFYEEAAHTTEITAIDGAIYIDISTNTTYRYNFSSTSYEKISGFNWARGYYFSNAFWLNKIGTTYSNQMPKDTKTIYIDIPTSTLYVYSGSNFITIGGFRYVAGDGISIDSSTNTIKVVNRLIEVEELPTLTTDIAGNCYLLTGEQTGYQTGAIYQAAEDGNTTMVLDHEEGNYSTFNNCAALSSSGNSPATIWTVKNGYVVYFGTSSSSMKAVAEFRQNNSTNTITAVYLNGGTASYSLRVGGVGQNLYMSYDTFGFKAINEASADTSTKADLTDLAPAFSTSTTYAVGQYVTYNGDLYRFTSTHTAGAWDAAHVTQVTVGSELIINKGASYLPYNKQLFNNSATALTNQYIPIWTTTQGVNYYTHPIHIAGTIGNIGNTDKALIDIYIDFRVATASISIDGYVSRSITSICDIVADFNTTTTKATIYAVLKSGYAAVNLNMNVIPMATTISDAIAEPTGNKTVSVGASITPAANLQPKALTTPLTIGGTSRTTVETALGALNSAIDMLPNFKGFYNLVEDIPDGASVGDYALITESGWYRYTSNGWQRFNSGELPLTRYNTDGDQGLVQCSNGCGSLSELWSEIAQCIDTTIGNILCYTYQALIDSSNFTTSNGINLPENTIIVLFHDEGSDWAGTAILPNGSMYTLTYTHASPFANSTLNAYFVRTPLATDLSLNSYMNKYVKIEYPGEFEIYFVLTGNNSKYTTAHVKTLSDIAVCDKMDMTFTINNRRNLSCVFQDENTIYLHIGNYVNVNLYLKQINAGNGQLKITEVQASQIPTSDVRYCLSTNDIRGNNAILISFPSSGGAGGTVLYERYSRLNGGVYYDYYDEISTMEDIPDDINFTFNDAMTNQALSTIHIHSGITATPAELRAEVGTALQAISNKLVTVELSGNFFGQAESGRPSSKTVIWGSSDNLAFSVMSSDSCASEHFVKIGAYASKRDLDVYIDSFNYRIPS